MNRIKTYIAFVKNGLRLIVAYIIVHLFQKNLLKCDLWIIQEKHTEARDNGYHLFKYLREKHPELQVHYVITSDSPDYPKVSKYNNVIEYESFRHFIYYVASKYSISSQPYGAIPYPSGWLYHKFSFLCRKDQKVIFLTHGIQKDELSHEFDFEKAHFSLICCAAKREQEFLIEAYGYSQKNAQLLGLCRFDNLYNNHCQKRQLLIMPTFRNYLVAADRTKKASNDENARFIISDFYEAYYSLLTDERILCASKRNNYSIVFYLHYSFQSYNDLFNTCANEVVMIADRINNDVQTLLMESSILVTDYSSVFFDFAYMGKPEVYFQFDEKEYRKGHYKKGYFDYERDGFGPVIKDLDKLIEYLIVLMENECPIEKRYLDRINSFFAFRDDHNCERTYEAIKYL